MLFSLKSHRSCLSTISRDAIIELSESAHCWISCATYTIFSFVFHFLINISSYYRSPSQSGWSRNNTVFCEFHATRRSVYDIIFAFWPPKRNAKLRPSSTRCVWYHIDSIVKSIFWQWQDIWGLRFCMWFWWKLNWIGYTMIICTSEIVYLQGYKFFLFSRHLPWSFEIG